MCVFKRHRGIQWERTIAMNILETFSVIPFGNKKKSHKPYWAQKTIPGAMYHDISILGNIIRYWQGSLWLIQFITKVVAVASRSFRHSQTVFACCSCCLHASVYPHATAGQGHKHVWVERLQPERFTEHFISDWAHTPFVGLGTNEFSISEPDSSGDLPSLALPEHSEWFEP